MKNDERDRLVDKLIDQPQERGRLLREAALADDEREQILGIAETADALWLAAHGAPALQDDPVAAMLGLLPNDECRLSSAALRRARKRAGVSVSDVAERLHQRGWDFTHGDVFRWETRTADDVPPAVVEALADILGSPIERLLAGPSSTSVPSLMDAVRSHPRFEELVDRWASAQRVSRNAAAAMLESRMLATVHRGEQPDPEQLLGSLDALVASIERSDRD